jgi:DNA-directed RNA polymerase subunit RPC12/RpoP
MANDITLDQHLKISRCPHCSVDKPNLSTAANFETTDDKGLNRRNWRIYKCARCGGVVTASATANNNSVTQIFPAIQQVDVILPEKVGNFLQQAIDSTFAPSGSIMLCASAVDAMLKERLYKVGSLYSRIEKAIEDGLLTEEMGRWAHQVRLDANDERHADDSAIFPNVENARQAIEFTTTLAELLFVLPSKVSRGIAATKIKESIAIALPDKST